MVLSYAVEGGARLRPCKLVFAVWIFVVAALFLSFIPLSSVFRCSIFVLIEVSFASICVDCVRLSSSDFIFTVDLRVFSSA